MSTHKHFDKICCVILAFSLMLSMLFMNAEYFGIQKASTVMEYENTLFDTTRGHTIDIIMDDWDMFTANCKNEEYYTCTVVIDNEAIKNVAIRGKGNTSLSMVSNDRYSYKIEFDHYDSTVTYHGLDKLCLNNIIQDNTYMKDYLTYQMMNKMGVAAPLCSYVYVTVNGEDWGLYLAVEGVEESFLQRNYGKDYGELYKPDSMSMGGGRGNGEMFDMDEFFGNSEGDEGTDANADQNQDSDFDKFSQKPNDMPPDDFDNRQEPDGITLPADIGNNNSSAGGLGGNSDVLLQYIDDDADSYSNIFDNAKTDITEADKNRLIQALKKLSNNEDLENTINVDAVIRYFVVHNFVLNFDSYTGSMIHNYYLYENGGQLQMIPWDYNLAFGGFLSSEGTTNLVNYPIDSPVSGADMAERPMLAWIFENEEYTELYHQYFSEFITECFDSGYFTDMVDSVVSMISAYVEKDPTKFCNYEEFQAGVSTLKEFCLLRAESVSAQLTGTIGSTSDTQEIDTLIDAGDLQIDAMGSMNLGGGIGDYKENIQKQQSTEDEDKKMDSTEDDSVAESNDFDNNIMPQPPDNLEKMTPPDIAIGESTNEKQSAFDGEQMQSSNGSNKTNSSSYMQQGYNTVSASVWIIIAISLIALAFGLIFAFSYKRRK